MIRRCSDRITAYFVRNQVIDDENRELYSYGLELLLAECTSILCVFILGLISGHFIDSVLFLAAFIPLRTYAGGYHANTHFRCLVLLIIVIATAVAIKAFVPANYLIIAFCSLSIPSLILVIVMAPVEHSNKSLSAGEKKRNKAISIVLFVIEHIVIGFVYVFSKDVLACVILFLGMYSAVLSMIAAYIAAYIESRVLRKKKQ